MFNESLNNFKPPLKLSEFSFDHRYCVSAYVLGGIDIFWPEVLDCDVSSSLHCTVLQLPRLSHRCVVFIEIEVVLADAVVK